MEIEGEYFIKLSQKLPSCTRVFTAENPLLQQTSNKYTPAF
jgi:hypothetical protein